MAELINQLVNDVQTLGNKIYVLKVTNIRTGAWENFHYYTREKAEENEKKIWIQIRNECERIKEGYRLESEFLINYVDPIINLQTKIISIDSNQNLDEQIDMNKYIEDRNKIPKKTYSIRNNNGMIIGGNYNTIVGGDNSISYTCHNP